ncbi:hypothetical protein [uncultured Cohaesibacter sp.]|uniref:hypothetical protein n=1 Tax=uncultured Cohaesibacter sp. TaxID=1002546 RepID=UPI0029C92346|nr:hypothetical protein [uncultured Cohaesibacter sp.]
MLERTNNSLLERVRAARPTLWCNPAYVPSDDPVAEEGLKEALDNWAMLAPLLKKLFPQLEETDGRITSELIDVSPIRDALGYGDEQLGRLFVKGDHALPVAGSVKARGGLFEVLMAAVNEARSVGFLGKDDDIANLASQEAQSFFSRRTIAVGSTGNLGLSVRHRPHGPLATMSSFTCPPMPRSGRSSASGASGSR